MRHRSLYYKEVRLVTTVSPGAVDGEQTTSTRKRSTGVEGEEERTQKQVYSEEVTPERVNKVTFITGDNDHKGQGGDKKEQMS